MLNSAPDLEQAVQASRLADGLGPEQISALASALVLQTFHPGDVLAREGALDNHLYVIVHGELAIVKHLGQPDEETLFSLKTGDFVHELGFLDSRERYASLRASVPSHVLVLQRERLEALVDTHPRVLYSVMRSILRHGHSVQTKLAVQAAELTNYIVKQHGRY